MTRSQIPIIRIVVSLAVCAVVTLAHSDTALAKVSAHIEVKSFYIHAGPDSGGFVAVSLANSTSRQVGSLRVEVWSDRKLASATLKSLTGHNTEAKVISLPKNSPQSDLYVMLTANGGEYSTVVPVATSPVPVRPPRIDPLIAFGPATLGLAGVLIGGLLVHYLTVRREEKRSKFDWRKMFYERNNEAYSQFLHSWGGSASPTILKDQFERLMSQSAIPEEILAAYEKTQAVLQDKQVEGDQKVRAARQLYAQISNMLMSPWSIKNH